MTPSSLTIDLGLFAILVATIASILFRTASAPLLSKIVVPSLLIMLACSFWYTLPKVFGYPISTTFAGLPQKAELIAFVPHEEKKEVVLWLREGDAEPRSYEVPLTEELKKTLNDAKKALANGDPVAVAKRGKPKGPKRPSYMDIDGGDAPYELAPNAFTLPAKDEQ